MTKIYKCDVCKKERLCIEGAFPKDWFIIKIYSKPQVKGGRISKGYHICKKCKERIFVR